MTFRSRKLLDLAHDAPCFADFQHECHGWQGCDPAHSDSQIFGRGHGHKTPDWAVSAMCNDAHRLLDTMSREEKFYAWLRAFVAYQNWLWENGKVQVRK
ncbi:MAG: hypothetical protein ABS69_10680 [Nitrosomonadales bacterium SCN 54-20]|nr:MAG: hypothetical protein ABS69_10680 [Nitrosomonadales bacterium SCN 54-20]